MDSAEGYRNGYGKPKAVGDELGHDHTPTPSGRGNPKAVDVLEDDWERMVAFYDFPEDHWKHLRTTNVVESPFAALRLRTTAAKRFKRVESATALIWKLLLVAEKRFRRLDAPHLLKDVFEGRKFEDGKPVSTQQRKNAA